MEIESTNQGITCLTPPRSTHCALPAPRFLRHTSTMKARFVPLALALSAGVAFAAPPEPKFRPQEIDRIQIGYGLAIADVDGDKKPDIILADKKQFVWYQNPGAQADAKWPK